MSTHEIPRNVKGEGRILYIFSMKSLIWTAVLTVVGTPFFLLLKMVGLKKYGVILLLVFALIGFVIGTFKVPELSGVPFTKKVSGEPIDEVIKRALKFKFVKKNKIYIYTKEEEK